MPSLRLSAAASRRALGTAAFEAAVPTEQDTGGSFQRGGILDGHRRCSRLIVLHLLLRQKDIHSRCYFFKRSTPGYPGRSLRPCRDSALQRSDWQTSGAGSSASIPKPICLDLFSAVSQPPSWARQCPGRVPQGLCRNDRGRPRKRHHGKINEWEYRLVWDPGAISPIAGPAYPDLDESDTV